jgi:signal transduction histidine kinase
MKTIVKSERADVPNNLRELAEARIALEAAREQREQLRKQLHDGLGQFLTSISFLASSLRGKLQRQGFSESSELDEILALVNQAIAESKAIAARCDNTPANSLIGRASLH